MPSRKQDLRDSMKQLSLKKRKEALKWIDNLSEKELEEFEQLNKVQLTEFLIKKYLKRRRVHSKKHPKN